MLRPATPLSAVLFVAFALLLLSVLSTPIVEAIPLSTFEDFSFGVFGFCEGSSCSGIEVGYDISDLVDNPNNAFDLPESVRNTLTAILIVHPIAAFLTLVLFVMAVVAHFHSPSHSSRYLLVIFIFSCIDFLICLLAFLIDVLVFIPHLGWGTYVVLAGTILVGLSGLVSCAMRRTLISRKARKKQITENAEMSGENYYTRENQIKAAAAAAAASQPTMPVISGGNGGGDNLSQFASFEDKKEDQVSDERIPLTARSPTDRTLGNMPQNGAGPAGERAFSTAPPSRAGSVPRPRQDQYGNPIIPPQDAYGVRRMPSSETNRSFDRMNSRGRGGMPPGGFRGRGGYGRGGYGAPPPLGGRGGYGPRGRGGYGPPPNGRGGYGPRGMGGPPGPGPAGAMMAGPPPPDYHNEPGQYDRRGSPADPYGGAGPYNRGPSESTSDYNTDNGTNPSLPNVPQPGYAAFNPERVSFPSAESPPPLPDNESKAPVGQAVGVNAAPRSPTQAPRDFNSHGGISDTDTDIAGMVGMQQSGSNSAQGRHDTYMSEGSKYSTDEQYIPPRQAWAQGQGRNSPHAPSPLGSNRGNSPAQGAPGHNYYEDVDPRFASNHHESAQPAPLQPNPAPPQDPYDDAREQRSVRARSPGGESDRSNFTSISQRSVNPRWNPPPPMPGYGDHPTPRRPPPQRQQDILFNNNPDFELPNRVGSPPRAGGGMVPGSAYPHGGI